ncbi:hypothetical protein BYT27DRAFT_7053358, partial [Phlegmacium glaucopus]
MIEIKMMMKQAGWLDQQKNINPQPNVYEFHPTVHKTGAQWKNIVKECREKLLIVKKIKYASTVSTLNTLKKLIFQPLAIELLRPEYFLHNFQAQNSNDRQIISSTILNFSLNKEQERAFHIIANHASEAYPQQLKMYLGGMGGTGKTQVIK